MGKYFTLPRAHDYFSRGTSSWISRCQMLRFKLAVRSGTLCNKYCVPKLNYTQRQFSLS